MARVDEHVVRKLEQAVDRAVELPRRPFGTAPGMQIGTPDIADKERIAREDEPRLFGSPASIGNHVGVMCGRVTGGRERPHDRVPKLDHLTVRERDMLELDRRPGREVRRRSRLDQGWETGDVIRLHVCLKHRTDRCAESPGLLEVLVDELGVRIDDSELVVRQAAEQVARASCGSEEKRPQDHACLTVRHGLILGKANLPIALIALADTSLALLWDATRLRLLVEIDRQGTVSAAARAVGIGQPTASEHLRLLEAAAGQRLVERNGRGSRLTEAGSLLAARAREALAALQAGEEELGALAGLEAGTIHIGASTTPGVYLLPDTLGCFRRDHPHVDVEVEIAATDEMIARVLAGRVQLALVGETEVDDRIELTPFLSDEIVGVAKPGLFPIKGGRIKPAALAEQTLLVREAGSSTRQTAERALNELDVRPRRVWELDSSEAIKRAAREGLGIAFLSRYAVAEEIERGELASFRLSGQPRIERRLYVARLARRPLSPSERGFIATLKRCCAKNADFSAACVA
jgi:LysR family transcriptional regulator, low CO2-responsive transcriptional regulator